MSMLTIAGKLITELYGWCRGDYNLDIPREARLAENVSFGNIPTKRSYYTAGYGIGPSLNHTETLVVDGEHLGISGDVLIGTPNELAGIGCRIGKIIRFEEGETADRYRLRPLSLLENIKFSRSAPKIL